MNPVKVELPVTVERDLSPDAIEATPPRRAGRRQPARHRPRVGWRASERRRPRARHSPPDHVAEARHDPPGPPRSRGRACAPPPGSALPHGGVRRRVGRSAAGSMAPVSDRVSRLSLSGRPVRFRDVPARAARTAV